MSIIWIIEKPHKGALSLAAHLQGDFPVRLFGSLSSFTALQRLRRSGKPDAVVVALDDWDIDVAGCDKLIDEHLSGVKKVYCTERGAFARSGEDRLVLGVNFDNPGVLSRQLQDILDGKSRCRHLLTYKNLTLDMEKFSLCISPEDEAIYLPAKEARLLKLFMEHAGRLLRRSEIQENVWDGTIVSPRTIDSHVSRLRKRLAFAAVEIESVYGGGYIFS